MEKIILSQILRRMARKSFAVRYWDGTMDIYGTGPPEFTVIFHQMIPREKILQDASLALGEAYMDGVIDVEGSLSSALEAGFNPQTPLFSGNACWDRRQKSLTASPWEPTQGQWLNTRRSDGLGREFYALWLDETMSYSCAYFCSPWDTLREAQEQKIGYILRKLQLQPGEKLLDLGSGSSRLLIRAAEEYGAVGTGITHSPGELQEGREKIARRGLGGRLSLELADYNQLAGEDRCFDKIVSMGVLERAGRIEMPGFFAAFRQLLRPGGLAVLQCVTSPGEGDMNPWIARYFFQGGYIPSLRQLASLLPEYGFHLLDLESLRLHGAMTLERWAESFENNQEQIRQRYGERTVRMWRLYLHGCAASFRTSGLDSYQLLFSKGLNDRLQITREHLYR